MAIYYYIRVVPKGRPVHCSDVIIHSTHWALREAEQHFGKPIHHVCNYFHPYQLKPEDRDWTVRSFSIDGEGAFELDVFIPPYFLGSYDDYKRGKAASSDDFGARYVSQICRGKEGIIGKRVELDFESFDYYLIQDNA